MYGTSFPKLSLQSLIVRHMPRESFTAMDPESEGLTVPTLHECQNSFNRSVRVITVFAVFRI